MALDTDNIEIIKKQIKEDVENHPELPVINKTDRYISFQFWGWSLNLSNNRTWYISDTSGG